MCRLERAEAASRVPSLTLPISYSFPHTSYATLHRISSMQSSPQSIQHLTEEHQVQQQPGRKQQACVIITARPLLRFQVAKFNCPTLVN